MAFNLRSRQQILADMIAKMLAETPVNDINRASVVRTLLEAAAQEAFQENYDMLQIIRNYNLDTTEGDDLVNRAIEYGLEGRTAAQSASGLITISDSNITKVETNIYDNLPGPVSGDTRIYVDDATSFPTSGAWSVIIGRGTDNVETVSVDTAQGSNGKTNNISYWTIYLSAGLANDHGTEESVILSQGGDRIIPAGTTVKISASDIAEEVSYSVNNEETILDGEEEVESVLITALTPGTDGNAPIGAINEFDSLPFDGAEVTNPAAFTNGTDEETDEELRDRIRAHIQSLSRGTAESVTSTVVGITDPDENKRVVSANFVDSTTLNDLGFLYIDDGTGFEPSFAGQGQEIVLNSATGGEQFLQLDTPPVIKAQVETINSESYDLGTANETLIYEVNGVEEIITFSSDDFINPGIATAEEVVESINDNATLIEARTSENGTKVTIRAKAQENESIQVTGGTGNTSDKLNFSTGLNESLRLYKFDGLSVSLLNKDGTTATIECATPQLYNLNNGDTLTVIVDGKTANVQTATFNTADFVNIAAATAEEVVAVLNEDLAGVTALVTSTDSRITLRSNLENSAISSVQVTGGAANAEFNFDTTAVVGSSKDYTLNRFNGQIELEVPASIGDQYTAGSDQTRGLLVTEFAEPYNLSNGEAITIEVDGGGGQVATFNTADFVNIAQATAAEVAAVINEDVGGVTALALSNGKVLVRTNNFTSSGSIEITVSTAPSLGFSIGELVQSLESHTAAVISTTENFIFDEGDELIVVMDGDAVYTITMDVDGEIRNVVSPSVFDADVLATGDTFGSKFTEENEILGYRIVIKTGASAGHITTINSYNPVTGSGRISMVGAAPFGLAVGDTFIVVPITAENVVGYLNNSFVTTMALRSNVELIGTNRVQISSTVTGESGSVQVTGEDANDKLQFQTNEVRGLDGYKYYTGLLRRVQRTVDGLSSDPVTFPGVKAAGIQIEVLPPTVKQISVEVNVTLAEGITLTTIQEDIKNAISQYINGLGVGEDVVVQELSCRIISVEGVTDVEILTPDGNVIIADNEVPRIRDTDIVIG